MRVAKLTVCTLVHVTHTYGSSADIPFWVTDLCFIIKIWLVTLTDENALTSNRQLVASLSLPVSRSYIYT